MTSYPADAGRESPANSTVTPGTEAAEAMTAWSPAGPKVQESSRATPDASVTAGFPVTAPPPAVTAKLTETPERGLPPPSVTFTAGGWITGVDGGAVWESAVTGYMAVTVIVADPENPSLVAVMDDVPRPTAVTRPPETGTVATVDTDEDQVTTRPESTLPAASRRTAAPWESPPTPTRGFDRLTVTLATATPVTVSAADPDLPSLVAVMSTAPGPTAVTAPLAETLATLVAADDQVDRAPRQRVARPVADRRHGLRGRTLQEVGVRQHDRHGRDGVHGHGEGRPAGLPLALGGDEHRPGDQGGDHARGRHRRERRVRGGPDHRPIGEHVAGGVPEDRGRRRRQAGAQAGASERHGHGGDRGRLRGPPGTACRRCGREKKGESARGEDASWAPGLDGRGGPREQPPL